MRKAGKATAEQLPHSSVGDETPIPCGFSKSSGPGGPAAKMQIGPPLGTTNPPFLAGFAGVWPRWPRWPRKKQDIYAWPHWPRLFLFRRTRMRERVFSHTLPSLRPKIYFPLSKTRGHRGHRGHPPIKCPFLAGFGGPAGGPKSKNPAGPPGPPPCRAIRSQHPLSLPRWSVCGHLMLTSKPLD